MGISLLIFNSKFDINSVSHSSSFRLSTAAFIVLPYKVTVSSYFSKCNMSKTKHYLVYHENFLLCTRVSRKLQVKGDQQTSSGFWQIWIISSDQQPFLSFKEAITSLPVTYNKGILRDEALQPNIAAQTIIEPSFDLDDSSCRAAAPCTASSGILM